jgi:hypothetical protein
MFKLFITSLFLMFASMCFLHSEAPQIGTRFEKTVGSEMAHFIANAQEMVATDLSDGNEFVLDAEQLQSFQKLVLNDSSYVFDYQKRCLFVPQIAYVIKGNSEVKILVSIVCNQIRFDSPNKSILIDYDLVKTEFNKLNKNIIQNKNTKDKP